MEITLSDCGSRDCLQTMPKRTRTQEPGALLRRAMERANVPAQHEQHEGDDDPIDHTSLPSDLMSSIMYLRAQMIQFHPAMPPVVLQSQLRAMLWGGDPSNLDRELDSLRRANTIRLLRISSGEYSGFSPCAFELRTYTPDDILDDCLFC